MKAERINQELLDACKTLVGARSGDGWVIGNVEMAADMAEAAIANAESRPVNTPPLSDLATIAWNIGTAGTAAKR